MTDAITLALVAPPALALGTTLLNVGGWPRGRAKGRDGLDGTVSVLIPARNEEGNIEACVRSVLAAEPAVHEVVVCDDGSTDATPEILARLCAEDARLRVIPGAPLPPGWVGKPNACHQLSLAATGDVLLFLDADVTLLPEGLQRIASILTARKADVVTAVPRQVTGTLAERVLLPLLHLTYVSWLPMPLVWLSRDPKFLAANGQVLAIRRSVYEEIGGFALVAHEVVDDMALCRLAKKTRHRVVFADGHHIARCRMYTSPRQVWEGFSKNLYEGIGGSPLALAFVIALLTTTFLAPWLLLPVALLAGWSSIAAGAALGVAANLVQRAVLAVRHRQSWVGVALHPVAIVGLLAIALNSFRWSTQGAIQWSGRTYAPRSAREAA